MGSFVIPEDDEGVVDPDAPQAINADGELIPPDDFTPERLDRAAFYTTLKTMLGMPGMYDADFQPLAVQSGEEDQARAASDAIYSLLEIWYPNALTPNSPTFAHLMVAVPFIAGKVMIIRAVIAEKRIRALEVVSPPANSPEATTSEAHSAPEAKSVHAAGVI